MPRYNLQKHAQQVAQGAATTPEGALQLQKAIQAQDVLIKQLGDQIRDAEVKRKTNPQAMEPVIQQLLGQLSMAQQRRMQLVQAMWDYNNSVNAQVRGQQQGVIEAILENNDQVLSQLSAEDYVAARDKFLRSAPQPNPGESLEEYRTRMKEWVYQYNPAGDLVEAFANRIVAARQQMLAAKQQRERDEAARRAKAKQEKAQRDAQRAAQQSSRRR